MIFSIKKFISLSIFFLGLFFYFQGYKSIKYEKFLNNNYSSKNKIIKKTYEEKSNDTVFDNNTNLKKNNENISKLEELEEIVIKVNKNQTFSNIIQNYLTSNELIFKIINEIEKYYSLKNLKAGQNIYFYTNPINGILEKIILPIERAVDLNIYIKNNIKVEKKILNTKIEKHSQEYLIINSLYSDGIDNKIPNKILTDLDLRKTSNGFEI